MVGTVLSIGNRKWVRENVLLPGAYVWLERQMLGKHTHTHTHLLQTYMYAYSNIGTNCDQFYDENTVTGGATVLEFLVTIL